MLFIKEIKLAFGLKENKIIHIDELQESERGLSCGCVCPSCGAQLQAKLGQKNRHHFSHTSENCSNEAATQTALHLLAKEIIAQGKPMLFPEICLEYKNSPYFSHKYIQGVPVNIEIKPARKIKCDEVILERKLQSIVPDVIFIAQQNKCIVEIAVTHFIDEVKEQKIKEIGLPTIEIDLSKIYRQDFKREELENEILNNPENRKWIYYPNFENLILKANEKYKEIIENIEHKKQQEEEKRKRREEEQKIQKEKYYKNMLKKYRSDEQTSELLKKLHFYKAIKDKDFPFFLDIPIDGEIIFMCDRRIWQSAIFSRFIYCNTDQPTISIKWITYWIKDYQHFFEIDWNSIKNKLGNSYRVIEQYLTYLHFLGFISELSYQRATLLHSNTLIPPNQENANLLFSAITSVDALSPYPNKEIEKYLRESYDVFLSKKKEYDYYIIKSYQDCLSDHKNSNEV